MKKEKPNIGKIGGGEKEYHWAITNKGRVQSSEVASLVMTGGGGNIRARVTKQTRLVVTKQS